MPWKNPHNWLFAPALVAFIGAAIGYLRDLKKRKGKFSLAEFGFHSVVGVFVGTIAAIAAKEFGYSYEFAGGIGGLVGMYSRPLVDAAWQIFAGFLKKNFGVDLGNGDAK